MANTNGELGYIVKLKPHFRPCPITVTTRDAAAGMEETERPCPRCNGTGRLVNGFSVYLTREHVARALGVSPDSVPENLRAVRYAYRDGKRGGVLIRLKRVSRTG